MGLTVCGAWRADVDVGRDNNATSISIHTPEENYAAAGTCRHKGRLKASLSSVCAGEQLRQPDRYLARLVRIGFALAMGG